MREAPACLRTMAVRMPIGPGADHDRGIEKVEPCLVQRADDHRQRLDKRGHLVAERVGHPEEDVFIDPGGLGHAAVAIDADELQRLADVRMTGAAGKAGTAGDQRIGHDPIADGNAAAAVRDLLDRADEFVADAPAAPWRAGACRRRC